MQPTTRVAIAAVAATVCATFVFSSGPATAESLTAPEVASSTSSTSTSSTGSDAGGAGASATDAAPAATPAATATATPAPATGSSSGTAATTGGASSTGGAAATGGASSTDSTADAGSTADPDLTGTSTDPTLAEQNAAGNHEMGSTVPTTVSPAASAASGVRARAATAVGAAPGVPGIDVSGWQTGVNWQAAWNAGVKFVYIKASESTTYTSSQFSQQYQGSYGVGMVRGAYHFAVPNRSSGATQANYFLAHGGGWSADGRTLPPLLDIEYNPYSGSDGTNSCYGLSQGAMAQWISDFSNTMKASTGIWPAIYSTTDWWSTCTGNSASFGGNPLVIARYPSAVSSGAGTLPRSWSKYAIWQYSSSGNVSGIAGSVDLDTFNGTAAGLAEFARTGNAGAATATPAPPATPAIIPGATKSLKAVGTFYGGQQLAAAAKQYTMNLQTDGNLVVYGNGRALWESGTSGHPGATAVMQADGNFVIYDSSRRAIWSTGTSGTGATMITMKNDGDLAVTAGTTIKWHTGAPGSDIAVQGTKFTSSQYLHSTNGTRQLKQLSSGALQLTNAGRVVWTSGGGSAGAGSRTELQTDGNLVTYTSSGRAVWSTGTSGSAANKLTVQDDGNVVLYRGTTAVWSTGTSGR